MRKYVGNITDQTDLSLVSKRVIVLCYKFGRPRIKKRHPELHLVHTDNTGSPSCKDVWSYPITTVSSFVPLLIIIRSC